MITIDGRDYPTALVPTPRSSILVIGGTRGFLGCGYLSVETAERLGDACAIVRGVKSHDEMLSAKVAAVSSAAAALGVTVGMSGREALARFA